MLILKQDPPLLILKLDPPFYTETGPIFVDTETGPTFIDTETGPTFDDGRLLIKLILEGKHSSVFTSCRIRLLYRDFSSSKKP